MTSWRIDRIRLIGLALRVLLGGAFLYAAWLKLREPWMLFAMAVDAYKLLPQWAVILVARTLGLRFGIETQDGRRVPPDQA